MHLFRKVVVPCAIAALFEEGRHQAHLISGKAVVHALPSAVDVLNAKVATRGSGTLEFHSFLSFVVATTTAAIYTNKQDITILLTGNIYRHLKQQGSNPTLFVEPFLLAHMLIPSEYLHPLCLYQPYLTSPPLPCSQKCRRPSVLLSSKQPHRLVEAQCPLLPAHDCTTELLFQKVAPSPRRDTQAVPLPCATFLGCIQPAHHGFQPLPSTPQDPRLI